MDQREIRDILSGQTRGPGAAFLRCLLLLASWLYCLVVRLRRMAYGAGLWPSASAARPVISVGNLTVGGTGKTPMVAWIVQRLKEVGARPAILTRGYKATNGTSDEAELLGRLTACPVAVDPDRQAAAAAAVVGGADVLVMDDGFQHLRLRRDLDIVLVDATCPFGYGHCLPRGLLREPPSALRHADAVVITQSDVIEPSVLEELRQRLSRLAPNASMHLAVHKAVRIEDETGAAKPPEALASRKIGAFCGIGNPESFFFTLKGLNAQVVWQRVLDDHVVYDPFMLESLRDSISRSEAETVVTTQKDFVKLADAAMPRPIWRLVVELEITEGRAQLVEMVTGAWRGSAGPKTADDN